MDVRTEAQVLLVPDVTRAAQTFEDVLGLEILENLGWMARVGLPDGPQVLVVDEELAGPAGDDQRAVVRIA